MIEIADRWKMKRGSKNPSIVFSSTNEMKSVFDKSFSSTQMKCSRRFRLTFVVSKVSTVFFLDDYSAFGVNANWSMFVWKCFSSTVINKFSNCLNESTLSNDEQSRWWKRELALFQKRTLKDLHLWVRFVMIYFITNLMNVLFQAKLYQRFIDII